MAKKYKPPQKIRRPMNMQRRDKMTPPRKKIVVVKDKQQIVELRKLFGIVKWA